MGTSILTSIITYNISTKTDRKNIKKYGSSNEISKDLETNKDKEQFLQQTLDFIII